MLRAALVLILLVLPWSSVAHAEKRVALVIGNGAYQKVSKLPNPINDAKAIAGMLRAANFDEVTLHENLGFRELRQAIKDFSSLARDADIAIVYYSGHGIEANGVNYLIPIDAVLDSDIDVPYEAYSLDNLLQVLEPARRLRLVILDACRDNPFARSMKRTIASRAVGGGLAPVEPTSVNSLIGFAAKAGSIALDGEGANSPYTIALLNHIATPGLDLRIAFGRVRDEVLKVTRNKQEPFVYGSLGGTEIALVPAAKPQPQAAPPLPTPLTLSEVAEAWGAAKDMTNIAVFEAFIARYKDTFYAEMARARIEDLKRGQVAEAAKAEQDAEVRRLTEAKRAEEQRNLEEAGRESERLAAAKAVKEAPKQVEAAKPSAGPSESVKVVTAPDREIMKAPQQATKSEEEGNATKRKTKEAKDTTKVAALPKIDLPRSSYNFDGTWTVHWMSVSGCLQTGDGTYRLSIKNGKIGGLAWSGRVTATGEARWIAPGIDRKAVHYSGTFRGNRASGSLKRLDMPCRGKFTATRVAD